MTFPSILLASAEGLEKETPKAPVFFADLNLDQIVDAVTRGREEYDLRPYFYTPLGDSDAVRYRQEVFRDLENRTVLGYIESFAAAMRAMRAGLSLAQKLYYKHHKERWFLAAVEVYCEAVSCLAHDLSFADLGSRGFSAFREYIVGYANSSAFTSLSAETRKLIADLSEIKYCLLMKGSCVRVFKYDFEIDYSTDVEQTFEKFKQGAVKDYRVKFPAGPEMNHVEAGVLALVAKLYPDIFSRLDNFCLARADFQDETVKVFDREIQFYVAYLEYIERIKESGLRFCYPETLTDGKQIFSHEGFDLALAYKLVAENSAVVPNDFYLKGQERIFVVSGPNQGGKTTFARALGQLHYLAAAGCPVPGREARLLLFDNLFTHFEKEENLKNLRGKLQDDLFRIHEILNQATSNSIIIMNEIFTSTTLTDAVFLSKQVMDRITQMNCLGVCVTFIDELATLGQHTVSMVSTVVPENPVLRTYKIIRQPADGLSYALSIAAKHGLTYDSLKERLNRESLPHVPGSGL